MKVWIRVSEDGKTFEGEAVLSEVGSAHGVRAKGEKRVAKARLTKPSGAISGLYREGFFASERTLGTVINQLGKDGYNFSAPSILMGLKSRDYLQRRGSKGSYRFVQKYPFTSA